MGGVESGALAIAESSFTIATETSNSSKNSLAKQISSQGKHSEPTIAKPPFP